jgi:hypothetical protein
MQWHLPSQGAAVLELPDVPHGAKCIQPGGCGNLACWCAARNAAWPELRQELALSVMGHSAPLAVRYPGIGRCGLAAKYVPLWRITVSARAHVLCMVFWS